MGVSAALVRNAAITGAGPTQDFTVADFGTPKAAIFIASYGVSDGTPAAHAHNVLW